MSQQHHTPRHDTVEHCDLRIGSGMTLKEAVPMANKPVITVSAPYPLLDPGTYLAVCTEATFEWARQWKKWIVRLVLDPQNYLGRPYRGDLCKFLSLGTNRECPFAGH